MERNLNNLSLKLVETDKEKMQLEAKKTIAKFEKKILICCQSAFEIAGVNFGHLYNSHQYELVRQEHISDPRRSTTR